jgi:hypothetical protein
MISYDRALRMIAKEILALRKETPLPPTPYVVMELASRYKITPWEGYDAKVPYVANLRRLVDRILRGDGIEYLKARRSEAAQNDDPDDDPFGADVDWRSERESQRAVDTLFPNARRRERLKRHLHEAA